MKYKYRYVRKNGHYVPEISKDGIKWVGIKENNLNHYMQKLFEFTQTYERYKLIFSDTEEIFFRNEISVNAFLAGLKIQLEEVTTEFEHLN